MGRVRIKFLRRKVAQVCLPTLQLFLYRFCTLRNTSKSVFALVSLLLLADHFQTCISWLNINRVKFISVCSTKPALELLCFLAIFCGIVFLLHVSAAVPHKVKKYKQFGGSKAIYQIIETTRRTDFCWNAILSIEILPQLNEWDPHPQTLMQWVVIFPWKHILWRSYYL